jgi:GNAT superfamily N-acetyltransferase
MRLTIRLATDEDIPMMYDISRSTHQLSYSNLIPTSHRHDFEQRYTPSKQSNEYYITKMVALLQDSHWHMWVAESEGDVVGYTLEQRVNAHLILKKGLFVDPRHHNKGIGTALFGKSLEVAKKRDVIRLSVIEKNDRAKQLYAKYGFVVKGYDTKTFFGAILEVMEKTIS